MSDLLRKVTFGYAKYEGGKDAALEDVYAVAVNIEESIKQEVYQEYKRKLLQEVAEKKRSDAHKRIIVECFLLAALVALTVNHVFGLFDNLLYNPSESFNLAAAGIATFLLVSSCAAVIVLMFVWGSGDEGNE